MKKSIFIFAILFSSFSFILSSQTSLSEDSKSNEYLFVITGDEGTFKNGKLNLTGVPIVSFNYLGSTREVGHFLVGTFVKVWDKNSPAYNASPPSGTLSVLDEKGSVGAVIQVSNPESTLNSITFDTKVLEGEVPASFNASSFFLKLKVADKLQTQN